MAGRVGVAAEGTEAAAGVATGAAGPERTAAGCAHGASVAAGAEGTAGSGGGAAGGVKAAAAFATEETGPES